MSLDRNRLRRYLSKAEELLPPGERVVTIEGGIALLDALDAAEADRDEWRQTALDERGAALDLLEQIKVRDRRIKAVQELVDETLRLDAENPEQYPTFHGGYVSAMEDIADALDQ